MVGAEMESLCSEAAALERFVCAVVKALMVETLIVFSKSLACVLFAVNSLPNISVIVPKERGTTEWLSITSLSTMKQSVPENKDGSETEDDDDEEDDDVADDPDDDDEDELSGGEDGDDDDDEGDPEDGPDANGAGESGDDEDDNDDDDGDEEDDEEEEEEDEDEEELPQPPTKKRK
ncbi:hypothetical protein RJ641_022156 [Dillenia turbinata]|uniref:Uncharacterized protein n=1 Tax=Dillenia turbinata TaxID=194707 RepID=A0AAN8YU13_9MAGN